MKAMETTRIAESSETLAGLIREFCTQINMVEAEIEELTRQVKDIDHKIEKPSCKYAERARLATELQRIRQERRKLKDWLNINKPYITYMASDDGAKAQKMINNLVGVGRRVQSNIAAREGAMRPDRESSC